MDKIDITMHSDQELSLMVMNDESLYLMRNRRALWIYIDEFIKCTDEQKDVLRQDLIDDEEME